MIKKVFLGILICLVVVAGGIYYWLNSAHKADVNNEHKPATMVTTIAPNLNLTTLTGKQVTLSNIKGKPIFLNFWATWCPPCVEEMPFISELYSEYKDKVNFVMVSVDNADSKDKVSKFIADKGFLFPVYTAEQADVYKTYNVQGIPTTYIIDANGNIAKKHVGGMTKTELKALLDKAVKEK
ncbi:MAG: TlpA disulfide reductase family protein [Acidaminococcaceae bacterium]|nr:TlpA disulfide reductase family protein [Acidaminococcaceae bacterium]MDD4721184.1 TlpA disulfide reductase family protein [Acidaminococcaceae bacterium]